MEFEFNVKKDLIITKVYKKYPTEISIAKGHEFL